MNLLELAELYTAKARDTYNDELRYDYLAVGGLQSAQKLAIKAIDETKKDIQLCRERGDEEDAAEYEKMIPAYQRDQISMEKFLALSGENSSGYIIYKLTNRDETDVLESWMAGTPLKYFPEDQLNEARAMVDFLNTFDLIKEHVEIK